MTPRAHGLLLLLALLLEAESAFAQIGTSFNRLGSGARAAGMANAFIAVSDDGTAASWNPAGLGQLRKPELSVVSSTFGRSLDAEGFRTRDDLAAFTSAHSSYQSTYLDFASLAIPVTLLKKPVTFQASWRRLYTLDYREVVSTTRVPVVPEGPPPLQADANSDLAGSVDLLSIAAAVKLTSRLAIGGSFNHWSGDWKEDHSFATTPVPTGDSTFRTFTQTNEIHGNSFSAGLMLTYPRWSVGLVHQGSLDGDFSATQRQIASDEDSPQVESIEDGALHFPRSFGAGGAWRPSPRWTVALDFTWDDWTEATFETPDQGRINFLDGLPHDRTSSRDTLAVNAGAERLFFGEGFVVPLRFGAAWEPQGARDPYTRDPVDFVMLAVGTGYNTNSLKFDTAFQYRWASYRTGGDFGLEPSPPEAPYAVGERTTREWRLKFSLIVRVTDTEKLNRTLKKIFGGGG